MTKQAWLQQIEGENVQGPPIRVLGSGLMVKLLSCYPEL